MAKYNGLPTKPIELSASAMIVRIIIPLKDAQGIDVSGFVVGRASPLAERTSPISHSRLRSGRTIGVLGSGAANP